MIKLRKTVLDFDKTIQYFKEHIDAKVILSEAVLHEINFKNGHFFTLLPENAFFEKIYEFNYGGILSNPDPKIIRKRFYGKEFIGCEIATIDEYLNEHLFNLLKKNPKISCVFSDYNSSYKKSNYLKLNSAYVLHKNDEVYFLIKNKALTNENLLKIIKQVGIFWYMLGILTEGLEIKKHELDNSTLFSIINNTKLIFTEAYDGEGYIFWEKEGSDFFSN